MAYTSLCKVVVRIAGHKGLNRLADVVDGRILSGYAEDFPTDHRKIYLVDQSLPEGMVAVWDWTVQPNDRNPEKPYFEAKRNTYDIPVEIVVLENCHTIEEVSAQLRKGVHHSSMFEKHLWCCYDRKRELEGLYCCSTDYEAGDCGFWKLKSIVYRLPVVLIGREDFVTVDGEQKVWNSFDIAVKKYVPVRNIMAVVQDIFTSRLTRKTMKAVGFSRSTAQKFNELIKNLPNQDIYEEIERSCGCEIEEAKALVERFIEQADKFLCDEDIESCVLEKIVEKHPHFLNGYKEEISAQWKKENEKQILAAEDELKNIETLKCKLAEEKILLEKQCDEERRKLQALLDDLEEKKKMAVDVDVRVRQKIEAAKENAANFIAEMAFVEARSMMKERGGNNTAVYRSGAALLPEDVEDGESFDELLDMLHWSLEDNGVSGKYAASLAKYLCAAYINKMPVLLAGAGAREIANAFSAVLFGRTAGNMVWLGDYSEEIFLEAMKSSDSIIVIDQIFNPQWNMALPRLMVQSDKYFMAVTAYTDDLLLEPKGFVHYFLPLFTDLFMQGIPQQIYQGGNNVSLLSFVKGDRGRRPSLWKELSLSELARTRIGQVLDTFRGIFGEEESEQKLQDSEMLFCTLPLLMWQDRIESLDDKIVQLRDEQCLSRQAFSLIRSYLGEREG